MKGALELVNGNFGNGNEINVSKKIEFAGKAWPQICAILSASLALFSAGTLLAWPSPAIPKLLTPEYNVTIDEASYLTVIPPLFMIIATPIFCILLDKIGRKYTLLSLGFIHIICWLLIAFGRNIYVFYLSRAINGFANACGFAVSPTYVAETASPRIRGRFGNTLMIFMFSGQFFVNAVGYYLPISTTALIMLIFPITFLIVFPFMPETPYYCLMKNDEEAARRSLYKLRRVKDVEPELKQIAADVHRQMTESSGYADLWKIKSNRKAVFIANAVRGFQVFCGMIALAVYSQYIFSQAGGEISNGHAAMIVSGTMVVMSLFGNIISDKLGRKRSMVLSSCLGGIILMSETIYFYLQIYTDVDVSIVSWYPVLGLALYIMAFATGLGVVPTLLLGELFSTSIRSKAALTTNISYAVYVSSMNKLFQYLMTTFGLCVPFLFLTVCCFFSAIASYFIIPDTKGKTIEEIQQMLKGN